MKPCAEQTTTESCLEDGVDDVAPNRRSSTKDRRITKPTTTLAKERLRETRVVNLLLAKLLALLLRFARSRIRPVAHLTNFKRLVAIVVRILILRWSGFLIDDPDVAARKYAFLTRSGRLSFPPFGVHILGDCNVVVWL